MLWSTFTPRFSDPVLLRLRRDWLIRPSTLRLGKDGADYFTAPWGEEEKAGCAKQEKKTAKGEMKEVE
jgi:hypothetical protein